LRFLLQYAAEWKLTTNQIDMKTAFLNGELVEEVYILPPPGLPLKGKAWRLKRALYGLKQAAHAWYEKRVKVMLELG
jgi:TPR repeat protein